MKTSPRFPDLLQRFFTDRLAGERQASPHTIASYRDTFRLLLKFANGRVGKPPSALEVADLDAPLIGAFLSHLENDRGIGARSRNVRLAAIHSFFRYVALHEPACGALSQRVLAIPGKRFSRTDIAFLTDSESDALLNAPDRSTWSGHRDYILLFTAIQTGLRVSELIGLRCEDVILGVGAHLRCCGKGRKERSTPLRKEAASALTAWMRRRAGQPGEPLFPNARGGCLSRDGVEYLLGKHVAAAARICPSLQGKRVSAHVLRHTLAMNLLRHGVDRSVIALWLGHESVATTQMYLHADMTLKEKALAKLEPAASTPVRYHPDDRLLAFLKSLG